MVVHVARLFAVILLASGIADVAQRLWSIRLHLDFRFFTEVVVAVLLIGSLYILKRDKDAKTEAERAELLRWLGLASGNLSGYADLSDAIDKKAKLAVDTAMRTHINEDHPDAKRRGWQR